MPGFALDNRGKRSVVLDLNRRRQGRAGAAAGQRRRVPDQHAAQVAGGHRPGAEATERHPNLVVTTITGYGLDGPDADKPGYDIGAFWARTGIARHVPGDAAPVGVRGGLGDHYTGLSATAGLLAALLERGRTGKGRIVETSLLRTGADALGWDLGLQMTLGKVAGSEPRHRNQAPLMNPYLTKDGQWFFFTGLEAARHLPAVIRALDRPDLQDDPRFATAGAIRKNRVEVIAILDELIATRTMDEWAEAFDREGVWWARARRRPRSSSTPSSSPTTASWPSPAVRAALRCGPSTVRSRSATYR